jgi:hypothetical protein
MLFCLALRNRPDRRQIKVKLVCGDTHPMLECGVHPVMKGVLTESAAEALGRPHAATADRAFQDKGSSAAAIILSLRGCKLRR